MAALAVTEVIGDLQPGLKEDEFSDTVVRVAGRGYTLAEIAYAVEELKFDPVLDKKLSFPDGRITAADFERIIREHRAMRAKLKMKLTLHDMNELIERYPSQLSVDDFGICDYTAAETPLYRFSFTSKVKDRTPNPQLMLREDTGADRVRGDGESGLVQIGEVL